MSGPPHRAEGPDARFRALLEATPDAMVVVSGDGRILLVNSETERVFGFGREELIGQPVEFLMPHRYRETHRAHRHGYFASAVSRPMGVGQELMGRRKDGTEFPVEVSLTPLESEDGLLVASAIRDLTPRKVADAERARLVQERDADAEANRIKDEFLATLSHELRTPLNAILGWLSLIETGSLGPDATTRAIGIVARNARIQSQLVDDLLDVSRIVSGNLRLQSSPLDLTQVADAAVDVVSPAAGAKQIRLETRYDARPILIFGDPARLQQVMWNLLSNAIKFTPSHGRVELRIELRSQHLEIIVHDSGKGIPPSFLPHVFERFRQGETGPGRAPGGLGLGLSIARSLVELHGGTIVASSREGHGATFRVHLPLDSAPERRSHARSNPDLDALKDARVLVIDDHEDERALLTAIFEHAGTQVRSSEGIAGAFEVLRSWKPDLIVADLTRPQQDGYALARELCTTATLQRIPALAVTGHATAEDRQPALGAGFLGYFSKPLDTGALLLRAAALLADRDPAEGARFS